MIWTEDTIAGAILGCVGSFFVQAKLQTLAAKLNSPLVDGVLQWWPVLFIVAGLVLLLTRSSSQSRRKTTSGQVGGGK